MIEKGAEQMRIFNGMIRTGVCKQGKSGGTSSTGTKGGGTSSTGTRGGSKGNTRTRGGRK